MLFAVAITNTGRVLSCSQVRNVPKTRCPVPESPEAPVVPAKPFSISSTHNTHGAIASAVRIADRMFCSDEPTSPANTRPTSRRRSGSPHAPATHLAVRLFPQPGTPVMSTPFGSGSPHSLAASSQAPSRFLSHRFRFSSPPTPSRVASDRTNSRTPDFLIVWRFSSRITSTSSPESSPSFTMARANAFSASARVKPTAAFVSRSRSFSVARTLIRPLSRFISTMPSSKDRISSSSGKAKSTIVTTFSRSGGSVLTGETMIKHAGLGLVRNLDAMSRKRRTTLGSAGRPPPPRAW